MNMTRVARRTDPAEGWRTQKYPADSDSMVEEVKGLSTKLKIEAFVQRGVLYERRIHVLETRPPQNISAGTAESARSREDEGAGIEPAVRRARGQIRVAHEIWSIVGAKAEH